jgi:hypothetical protein
MTNETLAAIWFIVGIGYAFVNGYIRKLDTDGDWLLALAWITLWPMLIPTAIAVKLWDRFFKKTN